MKSNLRATFYDRAVRTIEIHNARQAKRLEDAALQKRSDLGLDLDLKVKNKQAEVKVKNEQAEVKVKLEKTDVYVGESSGTSDQNLPKYVTVKNKHYESRVYQKNEKFLCEGKKIRKTIRTTIGSYYSVELAGAAAKAATRFKSPRMRQLYGKHVANNVRHGLSGPSKKTPK